MIEVRYERGVYLAQQGLWLDPWDAKPFAFISHAHSDHIAPHEEIIVSQRTARLLKSRLPSRRIEHILPFGEKRRVHGLDLMLLPAGHIFGSAQCFLFLGNETLLYTGDFKLRPGKSAEQVQWREADTLIMETTFGLSRYRFPPTQQVVDQIVSFCRETIEAGEVPVLLGYSLGKAQEILCSLDGAGLTPMLHGSVYEMTRIYEQFGQSFCKYTRYRANDVAGKVLICPPSSNGSHMLERIPRKRVAMISGWAVDPNAVYRYQVDAAFACDLRARGVEAWALTEQNQMELHLPATDNALLVDPRAEVSRTAESTQGSFHKQVSDTRSEFLAFAKVGEAIAAIPAKLEKIRLLSNYF